MLDCRHLDKTASALPARRLEARIALLSKVGRKIGIPEGILQGGPAGSFIPDHGLVGKAFDDLRRRTKDGRLGYRGLPRPARGPSRVGSLSYSRRVRIAVAADHAGYPLKQLVLAWVAELGHEAVDFGTDSGDAVDYPDVIEPAARAVSAGDCDRAIVLGGSGTGEAIVANKVRRIRCVEAADPVTARLGRQHNDANVLAMGARIVGQEIARACVQAFLDAQFEGGRHATRVGKITALEDR